MGTNTLQGIQEIAEHPLANALDMEHSTNPQMLIQWIANQKTKKALSLAKNDQEKAERYHQAISKIEEGISRIIDAPVTFVLEDDPLNVIIEVSGQPLEFDVLPDGLKSIVSWIADLLMRLDRLKWSEDLPILGRNFILFLDEIDVHLHPKWQRKILPVVQDLFKNAQIFVTTHSPFVVGSVDGAWVHRLMPKAKPIEPILSEDAKSFSLILDEIFDIQEDFGLEVERKLAAFRLLRDAILKEEKITSSQKRELSGLVGYFAEQKSIEIDNIIGFEMRQLKRLTKNETLLENDAVS